MISAFNTKLVEETSTPIDMSAHPLNSSWGPHPTWGMGINFIHTISNFFETDVALTLQI